MTPAPPGLLSVVVPVYNEEDNIEPLVDAVRSSLGDSTPWELILVDDGSGDGSAQRCAAAAAADPRVRPLQLARNYGQTQAMQAGFDAARGDIVVSMDGDLQNDPADIPRLVGRLNQGYDLVAGYRVRRKDRMLTRKLPSLVANRLIRAITHVDIRDNGCSLKAYRRWTLQRLALYSDMHRFLPALAAATAGARITEMPVRHHARRRGQSKYGLSRILKILADLLTIMLISWFRERPLQMFGLGALGAFAAAAIFGGASLAGLLRVRAQMADAFVLPASMLLWLMLGCYLLLVGLVGEIALRKSREEQEEPPLLAGVRVL